MKKILHLITRLDRGGSSEDVLYSYGHFKEMKWDVRVAYGKTVLPSSMLAAFSAKASDDFIVLPSLKREISLIADTAAFIAVLRLLFSQRPDLLHTHTSKAGIIGRAAGVCYKLLSGRKLTLVHSTHGHIFYGYYPVPVSWFFALIEKAAALFTDRIAALTDNEVTEHLARGIGTREKFRIIHSGVEYRLDFKDRDVRKRLGIAPDALVIGSAGRLDPVKGYASFIDAACLVERQRPGANIAWLLIGDGPEKEALRARAARQGLKSPLLFSGWVDHAADYIVITDIYVQPSLNEGMGKTVLLAHMLRRPVIATRVQGLPSLIQDGATGLLVPPENPAALAAATVRLIDDKKLRLLLGDEAQKNMFVRDPRTGHFRYGIPYMNHLLERFYDIA